MTVLWLVAVGFAGLLGFVLGLRARAKQDDWYRALVLQSLQSESMTLECSAQHRAAERLRALIEHLEAWR